MRIENSFILFILILFALTTLSGPIEAKNKREDVASPTEVPCTVDTLKECYEEAVQTYREKDYEGAKRLFGKIIAIDADYKKAAKYLKKCHEKIAETNIKTQAESQKLAQEEEKQNQLEVKKREEELRREQQLLEEQKEEARHLKELENQPAAAEEGSEKTTKEGEETLPERPKPQQISYRIGIGDILEVSVWRNTDLDKNVIVRPDGVISYPLVGDIPAVGLTLTEIDDKLTEALRDYVRNPVVSVAVIKFGGTKVVVLGEVKGPGIYSPPGGGSIIDVIALAGGFTKRAVQRRTFLIRGGLGNPEIYRLNLARIFKGDLSQNVALRSNDIIFVPRTLIAKWNDVLEQITPTLSTTLLGTSVTRDIKNLSQ